MHSSTSSFRRFAIGFLSAVCCLGAVLGVSTELLIRRAVVPVHNFPRYLELFRHSTSPNAIFGDSIIANGFTGIPGFVNMALGGDNFEGMQRKVRLYYRDRAPGRVILQAGLHHLSRPYVKLRDNGEDFVQLVTNDRAPWLKAFDPIYRFEVLTYWQQVLLGQSLTPREAFQADGGRLRAEESYSNAPAYSRHSAAGQVMQLTLPMPDPDHNPTILGMDSLLDFLLGKNAQVCLVSYPGTADIQAALAQWPEFAAARDAFARLAARRGVRYVDLTEARYSDDFFADITHPNAKGARAIAPQVMARCFD